VARTAAIAGTATAVSNRVSRRQAGRWADQEAAQQPQQAYAAPPPPPAYAAPQPVYAAPPPPPPAPDMDAKLAQLSQLGALRDQGVLSDAEFEAQKARILAS
jgi:hypothetical protein